MKRKNRIRSAAYLFGLASVSLLSCGGTATSLESASSISSEEPSSSVSSEEMFVSNVSNTFVLAPPLKGLDPESGTYSGNVVFFGAYETYGDFYEELSSILTEYQFGVIEPILPRVEEYMASSDDYLFAVWTSFGSGYGERWFDFHDNTLTRHTVFGCIGEDAVYSALEAVTVPRDMVEDFETVSFISDSFQICEL